MKRAKRDPCQNLDGSHKRTYSTKAEAKARCPKGKQPYLCDRHPFPCWHLGRTRYRPKPPQEGDTSGGDVVVSVP